MSTTPAAPAAIDPITFEVIANAFSAIVDDMGAMLEKVAFSSVTSVGKDYACALATPDGDVFSRGAGGLPLISGTSSDRIRAVLAAVPREQIAPGDVFLHNDPYLGGTHGQDVSAIAPVFVDGELTAFVMAASHWPDTGGSVPGSFNSQATETYAESLLIPPVRVIRGGEWDRGVEQLILRNVRVGRVVQGDLRGMVEACRTGDEGLSRLADKYGRALIVRQMSALMDHSERLLRQEISRLPDGSYRFVDYIDRDPGAESDEPVPVAVEVTVSGDQLTLDFSASGPQAIGPINASRSATLSAAFAGLKGVFHEIPWNEGIDRTPTVILPDGLVLSAAYPAPVSGVAASPAEKVVASIHGALIQVVPERCMACPTNLVNVSIHGRDVRSDSVGEDFVLYIWLAGGWGGRPGRRDAHTSMGPLLPGTNLQPAETLERMYPLRFDAYQLRSDSEGAGKHRGGFALECPFRVVGGPASLNVQGDRSRLHGWGAGGGQPAHGSGLVYGPGTDGEHRIEIMSAGTALEPDVRIDYWQSGGGGWGDPLTRPAEWVLEDVRNELVSPERAHEVYGVELTLEDGPSGLAIDAPATERLRAKRASERTEARA